MQVEVGKYYKARGVDRVFHVTGKLPYPEEDWKFLADEYNLENGEISKRTNAYKIKFRDDGGFWSVDKMKSSYDLVEEYCIYEDLGVES